MPKAQIMFSMSETLIIVVVFFKLIDPVLSIKKPIAIPMALTPP